MLARLHRVFADEVDELWLVGETADERERICGLFWKLLRDAFEQLAPLRGRKPSNCCDQFVDFGRCHGPSLSHGSADRRSARDGKGVETARRD